MNTLDSYDIVRSLCQKQAQNKDAMTSLVTDLIGGVGLVVIVVDMIMLSILMKGF